MVEAIQKELWRRFDKDLNLESPELIELLALWESRTAGGKLPARTDFDSIELARFGGRIALIEIEPSTKRFRFRLVGTHITGMLNRDASGQYLDELYAPGHYELVVSSYNYCIENKRPIRIESQMTHAEKDHVRFEAIDLPLASDGTNVDMIMKGANYVPTNLD